MRGFLFAFLLTLAGVAHAQEPAPAPIERVGPFAFGMSIDAAMAAAPSRWRRGERDGVVQIESEPGAANIGGLPFLASLTFIEGGLHTVTLLYRDNEVDAAGCQSAFSALLPVLEADLGTLNGAAARIEPPTILSQDQTPAGSIVRRYEYAPLNTHLAVATRDGARDAAVWMYSGPARISWGHERLMPTCRVHVAVRNLTQREALPPPPSAEELAAAAPLARARLTQQPENWVIGQEYPYLGTELLLDAVVRLSCLVAEEGRLRCAVASETPTGIGFGVAALRVAPTYRVAETSQGEPTIGKRMTLEVRFDYMDGREVRHGR